MICDCRFDSQAARATSIRGTQIVSVAEMTRKNALVNI